MGFGMAAMAVPPAVFTPPGWAWPAYAVVFGAAALRALWSARAGAHHLHHLVGAGAMVYMSAVMAGTPAHAHGHGGSGVPLLTGALLAYFTGYVLLAGVAAAAGRRRGRGRRRLGRPARSGAGVSSVDGHRHARMLLTM